MRKILHRYILREIGVPFALGLAVFTVVLLIARLLKLIELVVNRGVPFGHVVRVFAYIMPAFLEVTVPMAMLLAILVAFGRLSADSEIVAMRSSGLSLYQLLPPVALVVALSTLATATLSLYARPWGTRSLRGALYDIARTRATAGIKPQVFNDDFAGLVIYTESVDSAHDRLRHVLISDERDPAQRNRIFALEAAMVSDPAAQTVTLRLRDGFIHTATGRGEAEYQTDFESYDVSLDLQQVLPGSRRQAAEPQELGIGQLRRTIAAKRAAGRDYVAELVECHRSFAIPFACVVFGLVAVPLGVQPVRAARARGFTVSLAVIFTYYAILSAGQALAEQRRVPAAVGLWLPNAVFAAAGIQLLRLAARERALASLERLHANVEGMRTRLAARLGRGLSP